MSTRGDERLTVEAIRLAPGDEIVEGWKFPQSLYTGVVKNTVVVDRGVQVNLRDGFFVCPETATMIVRRKPYGSWLDPQPWRCEDCGSGGSARGVPGSCPDCGSPNTTEEMRRDAE